MGKWFRQLEWGAGLRSRSHSRCRPQARRLYAAGLSSSVVGRGELLLLPFKAMLLSERSRGLKSGSPALFAPSFNVQRNTAHNQSSGFAVAPGQRSQRALAVKDPRGLNTGAPCAGVERTCNPAVGKPGLTGGLSRVRQRPALAGQYFGFRVPTAPVYGFTFPRVL